MADLTYTLPTVGNANSTEDPLVRTALDDVKTWGNTIATAYLTLNTSGTQRKVAWGSANTPNYSGSTVPTATVTHGLGASPVFVTAIAGSVNNGSIQIPVVVSMESKNSTTFDLRFYAGGYSGANYSVYYWLAIA